METLRHYPMLVLLMLAVGFALLASWFIMFDYMPWRKRLTSSLLYTMVVMGVCAGLLLYLGVNLSAQAP